MPKYSVIKTSSEHSTYEVRANSEEEAIREVQFGEAWRTLQGTTVDDNTFSAEELPSEEIVVPRASVANMLEDLNGHIKDHLGDKPVLQTAEGSYTASCYILVTIRVFLQGLLARR